MEQSAENELTGRVIGCSMAVHRALGPGFNEAVYRNALSVELAESGIHFETHKKLCVYYKSRPVGDFEADVIVETNLLLELKAVETLTKAHEAQLVNYLSATKIDVGLLINFGTQSLQFKKKFRTYRSGAPASLHSGVPKTES